MSDLKDQARELSESELTQIAAAGAYDSGVKWWEYTSGAPDWYHDYVPFPCPFCAAERNGRYSVFCDYISNDHGKTIYRTAKCFACGHKAAELDENGKVSVPYKNDWGR